jgi:hypothetical protein
MSVSINGSAGLTFNDGSTQATAASGFGFKNRIINGDMRIDQRNLGASVTIGAAVTYTLDRFCIVPSAASKLSVQQNAGSVTPPVGFSNYLGITSLSSYAVTSSDYFTLQQPIEGLNMADLAWGTASASAVTLSFLGYSSLTGTFGGALYNSAGDRSYPFTYTISAANTWEQKSITIPGDTAGTWLTTNGVGMRVNWGLGVGSTDSGTAGAWTSGLKRSATGAVSVVGTNGATFYITGVDLQKGSTATSFDYRPYGTEELLCKRYFETLSSVNGSSTYVNFLNGGANSGTQARYVLNYSVQKRAAPSVTFTTASGFSAQPGNDSGLVACTAITSEHLGVNACQVTVTVSSGLTAGQCSRLISNNNNTSVISIASEL